MVRSLTPWPKLTRNGVPALQVSRRPLTVGGVTITVGEVLNPSVFPESIRRRRLRQFYEQRLLEPVAATAPRVKPPQGQVSLVAPVPVAASASVASATSVTSSIIPALDIEVPVEVEAEGGAEYVPKFKSSGGKPKSKKVQGA